MSSSTASLVPNVTIRRPEGTPRFDLRPRFVVEAVSFTAVDESGIDWSGSDEVIATWSSAGTRAVTSEFGDIDSGDTVDFLYNQRCIYPIGPRTAGATSLNAGNGDEWGCLAAGGSGPVEFSVWLVEQDGNGFPICYPPPTCYDDIIGTFNFSLDEQQLLQTLPAEGSSRLITKTLGGPCGYVPSGEIRGCSDWGPTGPEYKFRFRLTRVADTGPTVTLD